MVRRESWGSVTLAVTARELAAPKSWGHLWHFQQWQRFYLDGRCRALFTHTYTHMIQNFTIMWGPEFCVYAYAMTQYTFFKNAIFSLGIVLVFSPFLRQSVMYPSPQSWYISEADPPNCTSQMLGLETHTITPSLWVFYMTHKVCGDGLSTETTNKIITTVITIKNLYP